MKNKFFAVLIASTIMISCTLGLTACKSNSGDSTKKSNIPDPVSTVDDVQSHKVEGTLHEVNVNDETPVGNLVDGARAQYVVVSPEKYSKAAMFIVKHLTAATGVAFSSVISE